MILFSNRINAFSMHMKLKSLYVINNIYSITLLLGFHSEVEEFLAEEG